MRKLVHFLRAWLAYWRYSRPARKLVVIGITGTKGKSATCRFVASALEAGGHKVGLLSTVEFQIGDKRWLNDRKMTMLGRGEIQKMLKDMVRAGCDYAVIETSSEGILQYRHYGLCYDVAVFTNLGTEHSERHGGFEKLKEDKGKMFAALNFCHKKINGQKIKKVIVANVDDSHSEYYLNFPTDEKWGYGVEVKNNNGVEEHKTLSACSISLKENGSEYFVANQKYILNLPGQFNIYNSLAATAVAFSQGITPDQVTTGLEKVTLIPGRMEMIEEGQNFKVIVDYSHEPMRLTELFTTLRQMVGGHKIIALVGYDGGGRDVGKREKMGEIAGKLADTVIITDVNCFDEDPVQIAEMLAKGARKAGKKDDLDLLIEVDRRKAIALGLSKAKPGDVVVITAKGTEPIIAIAGGERIPWDDRVVAREELKKFLK